MTHSDKRISDSRRTFRFQNRMPTEAEYYRIRGECNLKSRILRQAIADFRKVVEMEPHKKDDRLKLIQVLRDEKRFDEALEGDY